MEAVCSSKIFVNFYQTIWHDIPGESVPYCHCNKNLKSLTVPTIKLKLVLWRLFHIPVQSEITLSTMTKEKF
jgi:hypothetical protein